MLTLLYFSFLPQSPRYLSLSLVIFPISPLSNFFFSGFPFLPLSRSLLLCPLPLFSSLPSSPSLLLSLPFRSPFFHSPKANLVVVKRKKGKRKVVSSYFFWIVPNSVLGTASTPRVYIPSTRVPLSSFSQFLRLYFSVSLSLCLY